jgi:hypothetical protein
VKAETSVFDWLAEKNKTMRKVILVNGIIAGLIVSAMLLVNMNLDKDVNYDYGMLIGYTSMVIALSTIFFGIKTCRDQYENGTISFGHAFGVGMMITLVASLLYIATWEVYRVSSTKGEQYMEQWSEGYLNKMKEAGATPTELQEKKAELAQWTEWYKNPLIRFAMTLMEILPVGIVISLIAAAVLRKREVLPVNT